MNLKYVEYLVDINTTHSLSLSAERLFMTQQALSRIVKSVENEYQIVIFHRLPQGLFLTEDGKKFLNFAQQTLLAQKMFLQQTGKMEDVSSTLRGKLTVFAHHSYYTAFLQEAVSTFMRQHPDVVIDAQSQRLETFFDYVLDYNNKFEVSNTVGFTAFPFQSLPHQEASIQIPEKLSAQFAFYPIADVKLYIVVNAASPFSRYKTVSPNQLKDTSIALISNYAEQEFTASSLFDFISQYQLSPNIVLRTNLETIWFNKLLTGQAVGLINNALYQQYILSSPYKDTLFCIPFKNIVQPKLCLGCLYPKQPSETVRVFLKNLNISI